MINAFKQIRLTNYGVSGANGRLNVNASGLAYYSELTGVSGVIRTDLISTGSNLLTQINNLSGTLTGQYLLSSTAASTYATAANLVTTGGTLQTQINNLSGTLTGQYLLSSTASSTYATVINLDSTGSTLATRINNLSGTLTGDYASKTYVSGISGGLQTQIDNLGTSLSTSYVTLGTSQTISGAKTFTNTVYIKDLYVTGTQTIVNTQVTNVGSNYLNLNATGGARDAGLFINLNSGGPNSSGAYIGFDVPSNTFRIGTGVSGLADLSVLDTIATQAYVSSFTASATSGAVLMTNVTQVISGDKTFVNALNLNTQATTTGHAVRADRNINGGSGLSNSSNTNLTADVTLNVGQGYGISVSADAVAVDTASVVVTTGTQTVGGSKTFSSSVTIPQATTTGHAVAAARIISGGSGIAGGGNLTSDVTLNIGQGYGITVNADDIAVNTSQVVITSGDQTINGTKTFATAAHVNSLTAGSSSIATFLFSASSAGFNFIDSDNTKNLYFTPSSFYLEGPATRIDMLTRTINGFTGIYSNNFYQSGSRVIDSSQTGVFATTGNLASTGSALQTQINNLSGTLTGNYVTTQFANATYATLVALNQKINWVSGQSQAFTVNVTTGVDTQSVSFPYTFTGGTIPTVQVTLDIPSNSDYMYNVAVRNITTSGFTALYSDTVLESNVVLNVWASKLYGSI